MTDDSGVFETGRMGIVGTEWCGLRRDKGTGGKESMEVRPKAPSPPGRLRIRPPGPCRPPLPCGLSLSFESEQISAGKTSSPLVHEFPSFCSLVRLRPLNSSSSSSCVVKPMGSQGRPSQGPGQACCFLPV